MVWDETCSKRHVTTEQISEAEFYMYELFYLHLSGIFERHFHYKCHTACWLVFALVIVANGRLKRCAILATTQAVLTLTMAWTVTMRQGSLGEMAHEQTWGCSVLEASIISLKHPATRLNKPKNIFNYIQVFKCDKACPCWKSFKRENTPPTHWCKEISPDMFICNHIL